MSNTSKYLTLTLNQVQNSSLEDYTYNSQLCYSKIIVIEFTQKCILCQVCYHQLNVGIIANVKKNNRYFRKNSRQNMWEYKNRIIGNNNLSRPSDKHCKLNGFPIQTYAYGEVKGHFLFITQGSTYPCHLRYRKSTSGEAI